MIKDNQKYFNRMHVVLDALVIIISYLLAWDVKIPDRAVRTFGADAALCLLCPGHGADHTD